jgi:kelch-like protein 10
LLLVVGGWTNGAPTNSIETYDARADLWQSFPLPCDTTPRAYHGSFVLGRFIYIIGGYGRVYIHYL